MNADSKGTQSMQFDTAIPRGTTSEAAADAPLGVTCAVCTRAIADEYFDVNGQSVCSSCRDQLAQHVEPPRGWTALAKPALFGFGAAIAGAILYYAVAAITGLEIGLVAIAIGYMVGYAVRNGAAGRGGRRFQVLALVLTYWSVGLAYTPLTFQGMSKESKDTQTEASAPASTTASVTAAADVSPAAPAEASASDGSINIPVALAVLTGLSLALPVLAVVTSLPGGLISAAIIAFGMQQAWRMTGVPQLQISGPYRIARASA
jgi:hypothetical protein